MAKNQPTEQALKFARHDSVNAGIHHLDYCHILVIGAGGAGARAVAEARESDTQNRREEAVKNVLTSPLLDVDYIGATGALIHVSGDDEIIIEEANRVGEIITEMMDNASVIWGARVNPKFEGMLKPPLIMTGVKSPHILSGSRTTASQLFNLEPYAEPEKTLNVELSLYQMENFQ